jgi:hypothetical protein
MAAKKQKTSTARLTDEYLINHRRRRKREEVGRGEEGKRWEELKVGKWKELKVGRFEGGLIFGHEKAGKFERMPTDF